MRKSSSSTRTRLLAAGFTTTAVAAALLGGVPAAQAAALTSLSSAIGPTGVTLTATKTGGFTGAAVGALFSESTCPTAYPATLTATQYAASSPTKVSVDAITIGVPTTLTTGTNGAPKAYTICTYTGATATTLTTSVSDTTTYTVIPTLGLSPTSGPAGGGTMVTATAAATAPLLTSVTSPGVAFNPNACPATYSGSGNLPASSVTRVSNTAVSATAPTTLTGTAASTLYNMCIYDGAIGSSALIGTGAKAFEATLPTLVLSPAVGSNAGGNSITATATGDFLLGVSAPGAVFTTAIACPATYPSADVAYAAGTPPTQAVIRTASPGRKVSNSRLAITVPAVPLINSLPTIYQTCVYNGTTASASTLLAVAQYTSTIVPTLSSVAPSAGSALGGDRIVVTGANLPTAPGSITATLGGLPLAVTPVSPNAFTAMTPMHGAESGVPLIITTAAGSTKLSNAFSFLNTIAAMPNTAPNTSSLDLSVKGVGFFSANFSSTSTDAHIFLVRGSYDPTASVASGNKVAGPVAECGNVLVITDNELICTLDLRTRLSASGTTVTPTNVAAHNVATTTTVVGSKYLSTTATFAHSDAGLPVSGTGIPTGTVITEVLSTTEAVMSRAATAAGTVTVAIGGPLRTVNNVTTDSTTTVTAPAGSFQPGDVGLTVTGTGIDTGSTITAIAANGAGATLSLAATATGTVSVSLLGAPVPTGAYNLTFVTNGALDANSTDSNYSQSMATSSSTFTVAPF